MSKEFPKRIYVIRAGEGEEQYFEVNEKPDTAGENDGERVAVYELQSVKRLSIKRTLDDS